MVNSKKSTKEGYTRSLEETELILDNIPELVFYKADKNNLIRVNKYFNDAHKTTLIEGELDKCKEFNEVYIFFNSMFPNQKIIIS